MKVLTCAQSRALEERAVLGGCDYSDLMETAGAAVAGYIRDHYAIEDKKIVVLCGKGNNGGDGFVVARRVCDLCSSMTVVQVDGPPVTALAMEKLALLRDENVHLADLADDPEDVFFAIENGDILVDAVYGIGFHGTVPEALQPVFEAVSRSSAPVIAVDIPSGLNGDSGAVPGVHIRADATVTFTTWKPVHLFRPAKAECGEVRVSQVGIGKSCVREQACDVFVTEKSDVRAVLKGRDPESHKGTYGRLLAVCGSQGMAGAAVLAASAAVRTGAGIVDVALPKEIYPIVASNVIEPVYTVLDWSAPEQATAQLRQKLEQATACLLGCGLGQSDTASQLVYDVIENARVPLIIDADGINAVAKNIDVLKTAASPVILTPHPGEMARLAGITAAEVEADRVGVARRFAKEHGVILVLKGHNTLVIYPGYAEDFGATDSAWGMTAYNMTGNAGMAKGGSGDVLAGIITGLCAQGVTPFAAAYSGVYLHGEVGDRCAGKYSQRGMVPTQMAAMLSELFSDYE